MKSMITFVMRSAYGQTGRERGVTLVRWGIGGYFCYLLSGGHVRPRRVGTICIRCMKQIIMSSSNEEWTNGQTQQIQQNGHCRQTSKRHKQRRSPKSRSSISTSTGTDLSQDDSQRLHSGQEFTIVVEFGHRQPMESIPTRQGRCVIPRINAEVRGCPLIQPRCSRSGHPLYRAPPGSDRLELGSLQSIVFS